MTLAFKGFAEIERGFRQVAVATARGEARAVRRTGVTIVANQSRAIAQIANMKIGAIKAQLVTKTQPTPDRPRVVFEVKSKGIPLKEFNGTRQTKKGVSVQVLKSQPRQTLRAAFGVAKFSSNYFGRVGVGRKDYASPHVGRLPIKKLYGPSVLSQYVKEPIQAAGRNTWNDRLPVELDRETAFALKKAGLI